MLDILLNNSDAFARGLGITLIVSLAAIGLGAALGMSIAYGLVSRHRIVRRVCGVYRSFWRGTPILIQLLLVFYLLPEIGLDVPPILAAILALSLNTAAFQAEIYRSGIANIPTGQLEAARMSGLTRWQTQRHIVMPQAFRLILAPLTSEVITIIKNSSLVSIIAVTELIRVSQQIASRNYLPLDTYLAAAVLYLVVTLTIARLSARFERRSANRLGQGS